MKVRSWSVLVLLVGMLAPGFVFAQRLGQGPEKAPGSRWAQRGMGPESRWGRAAGQGFGEHVRLMRFVLRRLDLSEEQRQTIRALFEGSRDEIRPLLEQLRDLRQQMDAATVGGEFDEVVVTDLADQQAGLMAQLLVGAKRLQHEIYLELTPEQQEKYNQMLERAQGHRRGGGN